MKIELRDIPTVATIVEDAEREIKRISGATVHIVLVRENEIMTMEELLQMVCKSLRVSEIAIKSNLRTMPISDARKIFAFIGRVRYGFSYPDMARHIKKNHTSIIYGVAKTADYLQFDKGFAYKYNIVLNNLQQTNDKAKTYCRAAGVPAECDMAALPVL